MQTLPTDIHKGMKVYDSQRNEIGKVDDFRFSENEDNPNIEVEDIDASDRPGRESLVENIADAFAPDDMPEVLRDRLLTEGYVRLDTKGLFASDRYILPEQIASTSRDALTLNVSKDELLKRH